jgi:hypothetical protein
MSKLTGRACLVSRLTGKGDSKLLVVLICGIIFYNQKNKQDENEHQSISIGSITKLSLIKMFAITKV